jgi:ABC-type glycerol-3-phosphate transport system substrate-binding protein
MFVRPFALAAALALSGVGAAACDFQNTTPVRSLSAAFEAWKAVTAAMSACGNVQAELDQEFRTKQVAAFEANPSLYHIGGVANGTLTPLLRAGVIRPLDDLVAKYGQHLSPNQLVKVDGKIMAIAMMVNAQHLFYRKDIFDELGLSTPQTYADVLAAAEAIRASGKMEHPIGATVQTGWNLAQDFNNLFLAHGGTFFRDGAQPNVNSPAGVAALETLKALTAYMDPEYLIADSTFVQRQLQQGRVAMANLWASRAGAMDNAAESQVVGKVAFAAAPAAVPGGPSATTMWWDGIVIARNITDEEAEAAFRVAMAGLSTDMVKANQSAAVWLIDGYEVGPLAQGVIESLQRGAPAYPSTVEIGLMHAALGSNLADYLTGAKSAEETLAAVEAAYLVAAKEAGLL